MVKICSHCASTAFDDMAICYGCLQPFEEDADLQSASLRSSILAVIADNDEFSVEEPSERAVRKANASPSVRFHVALVDTFAYDIYLDRVEGAQLTVGCARDNNIVLPHTESNRHLLRLYYAQGAVWAEDRGSKQQALIGGAPLVGTRCLSEGALLEVGEARIELINE
jgi:hypothetical protein